MAAEPGCSCLGVAGGGRVAAAAARERRESSGAPRTSATVDARNDLTRSRRVRIERESGEDPRRGSSSSREDERANLWERVRVYCRLAEKLDGRRRRRSGGKEFSDPRCELKSDPSRRFLGVCAMHSPTREISIIPNTSIISGAQPSVNERIELPLASSMREFATLESFIERERSVPNLENLCEAIVGGRASFRIVRMCFG